MSASTGLALASATRTWKSASAAVNASSSWAASAARRRASAVSIAVSWASVRCRAACRAAITSRPWRTWVTWVSSARSRRRRSATALSSSETTNVPSPCRVSSSPACTRARIASRTEARLTWSVSDRALSGGMRLPTGQTPLRICSLISSVAVSTSDTLRTVRTAPLHFPGHLTSGNSSQPGPRRLPLRRSRGTEHRSYASGGHRGDRRATAAREPGAGAGLERDRDPNKIQAIPVWSPAPAAILLAVHPCPRRGPRGARPATEGRFRVIPADRQRGTARARAGP